MRDKKRIKREILDQFRAIEAESNDQLAPHWLEMEYVKTLNSEERKLLKKAVQELIAMGIIENVEGPGLNLKLTQKGEKLIYSSNPPMPRGEGGSERPFFHFTDTEA